MARSHGPFATDNPWRKIGISVVAGLTVGVALLGFVVLPASENAGGSVWRSICTALGLRIDTYLSVPQAAPVYASTMSWTAETVRTATTGDGQHGAFIATNCNACHGEAGISAVNYIPSLAGMRQETVVKQLTDFHSGHRQWAIMNAIASTLTEQDMRDIAAYYGSLPPPKKVHEPGLLAGGRSVHSADEIVRLIYSGDPTRGIAPCASCHGLQGLKRGAPVLAGQSEFYLMRQLEDFRSEARANDEGEQMRVLAAKLSDNEIAKLAVVLSSGKQ